MKFHTMYYGQIVTEADLNDVILWEQAAEKDLARDIAEGGVFEGMLVTPRTPASTSVEVSEGVGRIVDDGSRVYNSAMQVVSCTVDEFGMPTFSDLLAGEGRWCSIYVKFKAVNSDLRTDGHGLPVWFTTSESVEFFLHIAAKGLAVNKATLPRPGTLSTAILLADIWFEAGSTPISAADIDVSRREDYFRQIVSGVEYVEGNPRDTAIRLASLVDGVAVDLLDADLPTGAADGAHLVGLGGTATQPEFRWADGALFLNSGNTVHDAIAKIVSDLGRDQTQGVSGAQLVSFGAGVWWYGANPPTNPNNSVGGALDGMVSDLSSFAGLGGSELIGSIATAGAPYALVANSVKGQLNSLLTSLNNHVNTAGHPATAISCAATLAQWADGTWLPSELLSARFETLVTILGAHPAGAGATGAGLIGCGPTTQTYSTETLTWPGNVSLNDKLIAIANSVVHRVAVTGDNRLSGVFEPLVNTGANLGSILKQFNHIWAENIDGGAVGTAMYINSLDNLEVYFANGQSFYIGESGVGSLYGADNGAFFPVVVGQDLGKNVLPWETMFLRDTIRMTAPDQHWTTLQAAATACYDDSNVANRMTIAALGAYVTNGAIGTKSYHSMDFIKDGMLVDQIEIDWTPTAAANMQAIIYRTTGLGAAPVAIYTINPTLAVRHTTTTVIAIAGNTGTNGYFLEMSYNVALGQRFHAARFRHTSSILDY